MYTFDNLGNLRSGAEGFMIAEMHFQQFFLCFSQDFHFVNTQLALGSPVCKVIYPFKQKVRKKNPSQSSEEFECIVLLCHKKIHQIFDQQNGSELDCFIEERDEKSFPQAFFNGRNDSKDFLYPRLVKI